MEVELVDRTGDEKLPGTTVTIEGVGSGSLRLLLGTSELNIVVGRQLARLRSPDVELLLRAARGLSIHRSTG